MNQTFDVFISYRRSDGTELAKKVRDRLEKRGFRVFLDERDLPGGQDFDKELERQILATPNYILIATPDVFKFRDKNDWVLREIQIALKAYESDSSRHIYPIMPKGFSMPEADRLPESIKALHLKNGLNLKTDEPTDENYTEIARTISAVNHRNMWNAGQRYLAQSKSAGRRFHTLHIDERIMPLASDTPQTDHAVTLPIRVENSEDKAHPVKLDDALKANGGHVYLIGEGGIGKTTAMISIMEDAYEKHSYSDTAQIPLFVELNRAPEQSSWYKTGEKLESTFIRRELARILLSANNIVHVPADYITGLDKEFSKETTSPEYLLLLDGLNEVSTEKVQDENGHTSYIRTLIINEIIHLLTDCPNVRVMLTSRTNETEINCEEHGIVKLHLSGVDDDTIRAYLKDCQIPAEKVEESIKNNSLRECLRIPLFLTIFGKLSETKEITSRGEILRQFFHERSKKIYSQQSRIKDFHIDTNETQLLFMLDFLLPAIGNHMEQNDEFYLSDEKIAVIIKPILKGRIADVTYRKRTPIAAAKIKKSHKQGLFSHIFGRNQASGAVQPAYSEEVISIVPASLRGEDAPSPISFIGEYGKQCFRQYVHYRTDTAEIAREILAKGKTALDVAKYVRQCSVWVLGILQENGGKYGFIHHHIRDYFAAAYDINLLRLAVMLQKEAPSFAFPAIAPLTANPNRRVKTVFIGEILGEHHNKPVVKNGAWQYNVPTSPEDRNLLKRALDIFRGRFGEEVGYGVYNLIEILKDVRGDLSKADLSRLDLTPVTLNGTDLGKPGIPAIVTGVKAGHNNLFPVGHSKIVNSVSFSPDGTRIVTASNDHTAKVWDAATGALLLTLQGYTAAYSPDGTRIVTESGDNTAKVWDAATGALLLTLKGHSYHITSVAYSPDGTRIVTASIDRTVKVWDAMTGALLLTLKGHGDWVTTSAAYSPDCTRIVTASDDMTAKVWDVKTGALMLTLDGHIQDTNSAVYNPDSTRIVTASNDKTTKVWDAKTGALLLTLQGHIGLVKSAVYNPDGTRIVTASSDHTAKVWDAVTGALLLTIQGHTDSVRSAAFNRDGTRIVTASSDHTAKVWDAKTGALLLTLQGHCYGFYSAAYSPDGTRIVTASDDCTAKAWNTATGTLFLTLEDHCDKVNSAVYSSNGARIVTASDDCTAKVWDAATGELLLTLQGHSDKVNSAAYSPDCTRIVTASDDMTAKIWNASTGELLLTLQGHNWFVTYTAYSPDGTRIVTASKDKTAKVWDVATGAPLLTLRGHSHWVNSAAYSPDGIRIVTAAWSQTAKVWVAATGALLLTLEGTSLWVKSEGHSHCVTSAAFNRDGTRIVTASYDSTAKVWDAKTGVPLLTLQGHINDVNSAAYSPDGTRIVTASAGGTAKVWDAATGECLDTIPNVPGLRVVGVDLRSLHPDSAFTDEDKALLRRYGAIVD